MVHEISDFDFIAPGDKVTIVDRFGKSHTGKAVWRGPAGWVLNMGGRYGTPGIATPENFLFVVKKAPKPRVNPHLIPDRRYTASVTLADGTALTTTVYGKNPTDAESRYAAEHPGATVVVRSEQGIR